MVGSATLGDAACDFALTAIPVTATTTVLYAIGGTFGGTTVGSIEALSVTTATGIPTSIWAAQGTLGTPRSGARAALSGGPGGWVLHVGPGRSGASTLAGQVDTFAVALDGTLGPATVVVAPAREGAQLVYRSGQLCLNGGATSGGPTTTVNCAQVTGSAVGTFNSSFNVLGAARAFHGGIRWRGVTLVAGGNDSGGAHASTERSIG